MKTDNSPIIRTISSPGNWIESDAVRQFQQTSQMEGMRMAVALPDLHPGKGHPVGAAFVTEKIIYPYLIGNDIGCGMALWQTDLKRSKARRDRWATKLSGLDNPWDGDTAPWLTQEQLSPNQQDDSLGTIGGGNHFAEFQTVEKVMDAGVFEKSGLDTERVFLLIHSGSRGLGEAILRRYVEVNAAAGVSEGSSDALRYLSDHDRAIAWARANRALIAHRFMTALGAHGTRIMDLPHNLIARHELADRTLWIHRKGAAPSDQGAVVIPGSRGALTYVVLPRGDLSSSAWSLAHGAGRKWNRSHSYSRMRDRFHYKELLYTELDGRVICENRDLLFEEAPPAYKNIDRVIQSLVNADLIQVIATFRPMITYKTRTIKQ